MSATSSITGRPPWAVTCWCDSQYLYTEIAGSPGKPPYIEKHALTEGALSKAIHFMRALHEKHEPSSSNYTVPAWPVMKGSQASAATREKAHAVLRKLRLV